MYKDIRNRLKDPRYIRLKTKVAKIGFINIAYYKNEMFEFQSIEFKDCYDTRTGKKVKNFRTGESDVLIPLDKCTVCGVT